MSLSTHNAVNATYAAHGLNTSFAFVLVQTQELALAVNLRRKHAVLLETCQHGIFCQTWLAARNAQHESHRRMECFYSRPENAITEICEIHTHLTDLLLDSAGGGQ